MAILALAAYPTLSLRLLALWIFATALLSGGPGGCTRVLLGQRSCAFFPLLLLGAGLAVVEPLSGVAFVALPAAPAVFRRVSCRRLPFGGFASFLAPVACTAPAVELCCWV